MTDVIKVARDRRAELQNEVARLEEFIEMAESLARDQRLPTAPARDARPAAAIVREVPAAEPATGSADAEDKGETDAAVEAGAEAGAETTDEPETDDAAEDAPMPAASGEAGAGLSRINLLRRGPRMVSN